MTKTIPLTQGKFALVDNEDFEYLNQFKWHVWKHRKTIYARREAPVDSSGRHLFVFMHREILNAPIGIQVDHKDRDGLNNTRGNIRLATHSDNQRNRGPNKNNKSGYKGVSLFRRNQKWVAHIYFDGKARHLGFFDTPIEAARVYDRAAREHYGKFAYTNFSE